MRCERLDPKVSGRVRPAVKNVDAQLFRKRIGPMRAFAGDESITPFGCRFFQVTARPSGHNANPLANLRTARNEKRLRARGPFETFCQFVARNPSRSLKAYRLAMIEKKRASAFQSQCRAELGIVSQLWMRIE